MKMRRFQMIDKTEVMGVPSYIILAEGVCFSTGEVSVRYRGNFKLLSWWDSFDSFINVNAIENTNIVEWIDE